MSQLIGDRGGVEVAHSTGNREAQVRFLASVADFLRHSNFVFIYLFISFGLTNDHSIIIIVH